MDTVLILYPALFKCRAKFNRKVARIVSQLNRFRIIFPADPNGYIHNFFDDFPKEVRLQKVDDWKTESEVTHAIVFDDGEEFRDESRWLERAGAKLRRIHVPITRVVNIKKQPEYQDSRSSPGYEYIGRGSYWGNPYSMYEEGDDRDEVIRKYQYDFDRDLFPNKKKSEVLKLAGKRLGCFCKPAACHGDVLANYLNSYDDGK